MSNVKKSLVVLAGIVLILAFGVAYMRSEHTPRVLASGRFHQVAHKGEGIASIIELRNGERVLRLTDFRTADRPNLSVLLISAPDAFENQTVLNSRIFNVARLESAAGNQEYALPIDLDLGGYGAVTIWNLKYQVNFTTAPLER